MAKYFISCTFVVIQVYYPELYPGQVRSIGNGFIIGIGTSATLFIPKILDICKTLNLHGMVIFGIMGVLGSSAFGFLKETNG